LNLRNLWVFEEPAPEVLHQAIALEHATREAHVGRTRQTVEAAASGGGKYPLSTPKPIRAPHALTGQLLRLQQAHGTAATTITSTSIPGRQKSVVRQARAGGFAGSTHSFQT
jgi:hypothetical protein